MGLNLFGALGNISKIVGIAQTIGSLVSTVQQVKGDAASGADKHEIVKNAAIGLIPAIEGVTGEDLNDPLVAQAIDDVIKAEKAALNARNTLQTLVADIKARHAAKG
jgi:hypothetical protein